MSQILPKVELIANASDGYGEYDPDQLIPISQHLSAINLSPVFIDDGIIAALGIPIYLNLDFPYGKHLLSAKIELMKMYKDIFKDIKGVNFTNSGKTLKDWNKKDIRREITAMVEMAKKLELESRYCIFGYAVENYRINEELASIAEQSGVDSIIYMNNIRKVKPEDSLLEAVQISENLSIPVSFAGRVHNLDMIRKTDQLATFILPPQNIFDLFH